MDDSPCSDVMDQGKERELEALYKGIQQFDDIRYEGYNLESNGLSDNRLDCYTFQ